MADPKPFDQTSKKQWGFNPGMGQWVPLLVDSEGRLVIANPSTGPGGADTFQYVHPQSVADTVWTIIHNLNGYPNVTAIESTGDIIEGEIDYVDINTLTLTFSAAVSGTAYLS